MTTNSSTQAKAPAARKGWFAIAPGNDFDLTERRETAKSIGAEITIVFLVTLGMSGLNSLVSLIETAVKAAQAKVSINHFAVAVTAPKSTVGVIDLVKQLLQVVQGLATGALGLYLLWRAGISVWKRLGLNLRRPAWDLGTGLLLAALIGIPGLGLYLLANHLGISLTVTANSLTDAWWRLPVTVLLAVQNGFLEEVLVVGYLITRLQQAGRSTWFVLAASAVLRGSYHLYQGVGGFVGNAVMGLIFGWFFQRTRRVWPLLIAHFVIDAASFIGYIYLHDKVSWI
jgi:membrane protease YdiL (CAAX protease family)